MTEHNYNAERLAEVAAAFAEVKAKVSDQGRQSVPDLVARRDLAHRLDDLLIQLTGPKKPGSFGD